MYIYIYIYIYIYMYLCVCVCVCVRARVRACARACVRVCARVRACNLSQLVVLVPGNVDLEQKDEAWDVPKPLLVSLKELGHVSRRVVELLEAHGATGLEEYEGEVTSPSTVSIVT